MAIPKGGFSQDKVEQGRYGPIFPKTPACYGFSILAKIIPGREDVFYEYARNIEKAVAGQPVDAAEVSSLASFGRFHRSKLRRSASAGGVSHGRK